jgi:hypothetical protein
VRRRSPLALPRTELPDLRVALGRTPGIAITERPSYAGSGDTFVVEAAPGAGLLIRTVTVPSSRRRVHGFRAVRRHARVEAHLPALPWRRAAALAAAEPVLEQVRELAAAQPRPRQALLRRVTFGVHERQGTGDVELMIRDLGSAQELVLPRGISARVERAGSANWFADLFDDQGRPVGDIAHRSYTERISESGPWQRRTLEVTLDRQARNWTPRELARLDATVRTWRRHRSVAAVEAPLDTIAFP